MITSSITRMAIIYVACFNLTSTHSSLSQDGKTGFFPWNSEQGIVRNEIIIRISIKLYCNCMGTGEWGRRGGGHFFRVLFLRQVLMQSTLSDSIDIIWSNSWTSSGNVGLLSANSFQQFSISWYLRRRKYNEKVSWSVLTKISLQ